MSSTKRLLEKCRTALLRPTATTPVLIATACLAAIFVAEILGGDSVPPQRDQAATPTARIVSAPSDRNLPATEGVSGRLMMTASTILSKPLFAPDRLPAAEPAKAAMAGDIRTPVKLVGTIASNGMRVAFVELAGKQVARAVGDSVGSSRIIEIDAARIRVKSADGQVNDVRLSWGTFIEPTPPTLERSHIAFHLEQ